MAPLQWQILSRTYRLQFVAIVLQITFLGSSDPIQWFLINQPSTAFNIITKMATKLGVRELFSGYTIDWLTPMDRY